MVCYGERPQESLVGFAEGQRVTTGASAEWRGFRRGSEAPFAFLTAVGEREKHWRKKIPPEAAIVGNRLP